MHLIIMLMRTPPSFICYPPTPSLSFTDKKIMLFTSLYIHSYEGYELHSEYPCAP